MLSYEERIKQFNKIVNSSHKIIFFGGAGVSTASGIPDFRSEDGLYNSMDPKYGKMEPEYILSNGAIMDNPELFYEFYRDKMDTRDYEPNAAHKKIAELEEKGRLIAVITQNIDGLHQKAGSKRVYEIHGTTSRAYCTKCGRKYNGNVIFESEEKIPYCPYCSTSKTDETIPYKKGIIRPDVTLYGEEMPKDFAEAAEVLNQGDTLIVGGTSLTVEPANLFVQQFYGLNIIIINKDATPYDEFADVVFHENIEDVFADLEIEPYTDPSYLASRKREDFMLQAQKDMMSSSWRLIKLAKSHGVNSIENWKNILLNAPISIIEEALDDGFGAVALYKGSVALFTNEIEAQKYIDKYCDEDEREKLKIINDIDTTFLCVAFPPTIKSVVLDPITYDELFLADKEKILEKEKIVDEE